MNQHRLAAIATLALLGCGPASNPVEVEAPALGRSRHDSSGDPTFFVNATDAPPFATRVVNLWAVRGRTREARIYYQPRPGETDSTEFLRFKVDARSLVARPDGTPIAEGDSLLITLTVSDGPELIVDFQPSGLRFNPRRRPELEFRMAECDLDLNRDGVVDQLDRELLRTARIFRQESLGLPWEALSTTQAVLDFKTRIDGFTRYAVAY